MNARSDETPERLRELQRRWEVEIRPSVEAIAAGFPTAVERDLARRLSVALHNALLSGGWLASDLLSQDGTGGDIVEMRASAKAVHEEAERLAEDLARAIRGPDH